MRLTGTVHFGGGWKTGVEISQSTTITDELRRYPWGEERLSQTQRGMAYSVFQERSQEAEPQAWLTLALGAGFVANAWISVSTSGSLAVPVLGVGVPVTSLGVRLRYALDPKGKEEVGVRTALKLQGDRAWVSLDVEWAGRGP